MVFFNPSEPLLRAKQKHLDVQDLKGLWQIDLKVGDRTLFSNFYTSIDRIFLLWGWSCLIIFAIPQFLPIAWTTQAYWGSVLTIIGILAMAILSYCWVRVERVTWLVYGWTVLMAIGLGLTNLGIFCGWGLILLNLCPLWLGLSAAGYLATGIGLRSRTFLLAGIFHLLAIPFLSYLPAWQFLITGAVVGGTLLLLAEIQWDMRPPIESNLLTAQQLAFNREQQRRRQMS